MPYGIVYQATCLKNGKCYIGQTRKTLEQRKKAHGYAAKYSKGTSHWINAVRKYGVDGFMWEVLAEAKSQKQLNTLESKAICEADSIRSGYNSTDGGEHPLWDQKARRKAQQAQQARCSAERDRKLSAYPEYLALALAQAARNPVDQLEALLEKTDFRDGETLAFMLGVSERKLFEIVEENTEFEEVDIEWSGPPEPLRARGQVLGFVRPSEPCPPTENEGYNGRHFDPEWAKIRGDAPPLAA